MNHSYTDITDRIDEKPKWWDEAAVPRFCEFGPRESANIYATQVVLVEIACQNCGARFKVCFSHSPGWDIARDEMRSDLTEAVKADAIHYGDPPNAGCCAAGPTMNSVPHRVLEFWDRDPDREWVRVSELEKEIDCGWA